MEVLALAGALFILIWAVVKLLRFLFDVASFDVFGVYYDDPTSPYYHDRRGKGRGRR